MNYKKASGRHELRPSINHAQGSEASFNQGQMEDTVSVELIYSKSDGLAESRLFFLFVEGESKEMGYFKYLEGKNKYSNLRVISIPMSNSQEYKGNLVSKISLVLQKILRNRLVTYKGRDITVEDIDSVYVVIDVDDLYEQIKIEKDKMDIATWIISNPCFEIWLYYTYYDNPQKDLSLEHIEPPKRSKHIKTKLNNLHDGGIGCRDAFYRIQDACANSMKNYIENDDGMPALYSTKMHVLALDIYKLIELEYKERLHYRQEQIAKFYKLNG